MKKCSYSNATGGQFFKAHPVYESKFQCVYYLCFVNLKNISGSPNNPALGKEYGCEWEVFNIWMRYHSGQIKDGRVVYIKRKYCSDAAYLSGTDSKWIWLEEERSTCEYWTIKKA